MVVGLINKVILLLVVTAVIAAALLVTYSPAFAASTATVNATVTVQNISMTVANNTITWGTLPLGTASSTNSAYTNTLTNSGNVAENFLVKGQDSNGGWVLSSVSGIDKYVESVCSTGCSNAPTGYTPLTTTNATLASNVSTSTTASLDLYIKVPTSTSVFSQQSVDITITATAF